MVTEKKNQHYIPKFYLRNFSFQGNGKQIGIYNISNEFFFSQAKLKTQGSKNFFYGYDGKVEDSLARIEGQLAQTIKSIIEKKELTGKDTPGHFELLTFVALTDIRNPVKIESLKSMFNEMRNRILEINSKTEIDNIFPTMTHEEIIDLSFSKLGHIIENISDLEFKLLINVTQTPFITSDFPVIKYNQFLEQKNWPKAKTGFGTTGLQIFIPINSEITILLFDSGIYKVGDRKKKYYLITNPKDIDELNILQYLNCLETIFFNEKATEVYIKRLHSLSKRHQRANLTKSEIAYLFKNEKQKEEILKAGFKNLMIVGTTDCETNLNINGIRIHSNGQNHKLHPSITQLRPLPALIHDRRKVKGEG